MSKACMEYLLLYEHGVFLQECAEKESQVLDEVLFIVLSILVGLSDVGA